MFVVVCVCVLLSLMIKCVCLFVSSCVMLCVVCLFACFNMCLYCGELRFDAVRLFCVCVFVFCVG